MTPEQLHVYTEEVYIHTAVALREYDALIGLVSNPNTRQMREVWVRLQAFLTHLGMVSKLFFAPSARKSISKSRAQELRNYLGVTNTSALDDRAARNAIEHLDERMDNWLQDDGKGILECVFEDRPSYEYLDKDHWKVRRVFLIDESVFVTEENDGPKEMPLGPAVGELHRIKKCCEEKLEDSNPYHVIQPNRG